MKGHIRHRRIEIRRSAFGGHLFADYYRAGAPFDPAAPLLCFWGGALSREEYERERRHPSEVLVAEWLRAASTRAPDLVVLAVPDVEPCNSEEVRRRVLCAFEEQLLPACPNPRPRGVGFLGYSVGAFLATCLALDVSDARALATIGGVGMTMPLLDTPRARRPGFPISIFVNIEDPCADQTSEFTAALAERDIPALLDRRRGGHNFEDYVRNGAVRAALAAVAEPLGTAPALARHTG